MRTMMIQVWSGGNRVSHMSLSLRMRWELTGSSGVGDGIGKNLGKIKEYTASLVQDLDTGFDLEVLAHGDVEWIQGRFALPEEVGDIEHVRCCVIVSMVSMLKGQSELT